MAYRGKHPKVIKQVAVSNGIALVKTNDGYVAWIKAADNLGLLPVVGERLSQYNLASQPIN